MADEFIPLHQGVYNEFVGDMRIERSKWNMVITYDMEELNIKLAQTENVFRDLNNFCIKMERLDKNSCIKQINFAKDSLNRLDKDQKRIFELFGSSESKRGLGFKLFSGTLDSEDAKEISHQIYKLEQKTITHNDLLKKQINFIDNIFKLENDTIGHVEYNSKLIKEQNDEINYMKNTLIQMQKSERMEVFSRNNDIFHMLYNLIHEDFKNLERFLIDTHSNILNTQFLSNTELINEIKKNINNIPNQELPFDVSNPNINDLINFFKLGYMYNKNKLYIIVQIPLMESKNYKIYDLQPIPVCKGKNCVSYKISTDFYVVNKENEKHFKINSNFMDKNCKLMNNIYYCSEIQIKYNKYDESCETALFNSEQKSIDVFCNHTAFDIRDQLIVKLFNDNSYLLINTNDQHEQSTLRCEGIDDEYRILFGIYKIEINRNCVLIFKKLTLQFKHITTTSTSKQTLFQNLNFEFTEEITDFMNNKTVEIRPHIIDTNAYKNIGESIENLKKEMNQKKKENSEKSTFIFYSIINFTIQNILMILVILSICILFKKYYELNGHLTKLYRQMLILDKLVEP